MCKKTTQQATYDSLRSNGPMTSAQIVGKTKRDLNSVKVALSHLQAAQRVSLTNGRWQAQDGVPRYPRIHAWTLGPPIPDGLWT